jgi:hypothetical protein
MKTFLTTILFTTITACCSYAQIGIRTTTPNSSLDVRGSIATSYRSFLNNTIVTATDNMVIFTGSATAMVTLPSAVGCTGRNYLIKNASTTLPTPLLTITTSAAETIDGNAAWLLIDAGETITLISNGTGWHIAKLTQPPATGLLWTYNGNTVAATTTIGTTSNHDVPFITGNIERMRLNTSGSFGIGAAAFDATNPEKLLADAGTTTSYNVISGKGSIDNYLQLNIQNRSAGNTASSDLVASANNGTELLNYIDLGINSSGFNNTAYPVLDGINTAYLYNTGNDFIIGNATANKDLVFFSGGFDASKERMRITGTGFTGIGTTTPAEKLQVEGNIRLSGLNNAVFFDSSVDPYAGIKNISRTGEVNELMLFSGNDVTGTFGADRIRLASHELYFATSPATGTATGDPSSFYADTANAKTRLFINGNGKVAVGTTTFSATKPEQLLVDAGVTNSYNVISGKGNINNYLQLNIQNNNGGASASSDIVATADNGSETSNYVNLGINSDGYTGSGIMAGVNNAYLYTTGNDFIIGNSTDNKNLVFYTTTGGASAQRMRITSAGLLPGLDNGYLLGNGANRNTSIWAVNGTIQTSDARLKKNIHALSYGLAQVLQLNPVSYNWIDTRDRADKIGLIAQEVKNVLPEVVSNDAGNNYMGVNYAEIVPVLINAVKELKNRVEILKKRAKELQLID